MATKKQSEAAISISVGTKVLLLARKLAVPPTANQLVVLDFAPAVSDPVVVVGEPTPQQIDAALEQAGVDGTLLARAFIGMGNNSQNLTPQLIYSLSPVFWNTGGEAANQIVTVAVDGVQRASGLLSVIFRAASGFHDHQHQLLGKRAGDVTLIKPIGKCPGLAKSVLGAEAPAPNAAFARALTVGFTGDDLPAMAIRAGKSSATAVSDDPFADLDLDGWL